MDTIEAGALALFDLLARHWSLNAPVQRLAFDRAGHAVAFALGDGGLALAPLADAESPIRRCRQAVDGGRLTISARRDPVPPLVRHEIAAGTPHLVPFGADGFLAGSDGPLRHVSADGLADPATIGGVGPIDALARLGPEAAVIATSGMIAVLPGPAAVPRPLFRIAGPVAALAASADGGRLAIAAEGAVTVRECRPAGALLGVYDVAGIRALAWAPDGGRLAAGGGGLALIDPRQGSVVRLMNYPAPVGSLAWSADSRRLATGGAFRPLVWAVGDADEARAPPSAVATGPAGTMLVTAVAITPGQGPGLAPGQELIGTGYNTGMVAVSAIGRPEQLVVRAPGGGAVQALAWSPDGRHLAFGTAGGLAAILTFPPPLFK